MSRKVESYLPIIKLVRGYYSAYSLYVPSITAASGQLSITSLKDPVNPQDAATKNYVDNKSVNGYTQTSSATVANTLTETTLLTSGVGSLTIPANYLTIGKTIVIKVVGNHSATANPNITINVKLGSTTVLTTGAVASGNSTNSYFDITAYITCRTVGTSGTVWGEGYYVETGGGTGRFSMSNTSATTINTTMSQTVNVTAQWGTASTSDSITSNVAYMYFIN